MEKSDQKHCTVLIVREGREDTVYSNVESQHCYLDGAHRVLTFFYLEPKIQARVCVRIALGIKDTAVITEVK